MGNADRSPVSVTRRIDAPAGDIKRQPWSSHSSNVEVETSTLSKLLRRWRATEAMPTPGSTAVTEDPRAAKDLVAWPVPQPTSNTDDLSWIPVIATRSANSS